MTERETFTDTLRKHTRRATTFSDKLINAKFAMTIGTDDVYAEGVLAFFEVYKFLEIAMKAQEGRNLGRLFINGLARSEACVEDLNSYLGSNWVIPYQMREATRRYVHHLHRLYLTDPDLLIPHVYLMYVELLSGGQLVKTRKELENVFDPHEGGILRTAMVDFGEHDPAELRNRLAREVNAIAETFDIHKRECLIREGGRVFEFVNNILRSIESVDRLLAQRFIFLSFCILALIVIYCLLTY